MTLTVTRSSFKLIHAKLLKGGGIEVSDRISATIDNARQEIKRKEELPIVPHPDLERAFEDFKDILLKSTGYLDSVTIATSKEFAANDKQIQAFESFLSKLREKVKVTSIDISGEDKTEGIIINGTFKTYGGSNISLNSPRLRFHVTTYGFEEDLVEKVENLENEIFAYLHEGKKAQLDLFPDQDKPVDATAPGNFDNDGEEVTAAGETKKSTKKK